MKNKLVAIRTHFTCVPTRVRQQATLDEAILEQRGSSYIHLRWFIKMRKILGKKVFDFSFLFF